ncbi:MAG: hypothetical protein JNL54_18230 [Kineosporiaceae bacterium]|nr:hypothetical protein [Kineosporiaceae bacterium]
MSREPPPIPADWLAWVSRLRADGGPDGATWARGLPRRLTDVLADWDLEPTGEPVRTGWTAVVVPVRRQGAAAMLKLLWPHREALGEHLALRRWAGEGAVRLLAADPARHCLLLERLDADRDLTGLDTDQACAVIGGLLRRLHVPALPRLVRLDDVVRDELGELDREPGSLPRRVVDQTRALFRDLDGDPASTATLVHTDLHDGNVLAGEREPWLAIDPKPMAGHPGFEVEPILRNRAQEYRHAPSIRRGVRRRFEIVCESAGLDRSLAREWTIVHATVDAFRAARDGERDQVGLFIAILKALEE